MEFSEADCINHDSHKLDYFNSFISYELPPHVTTKKDLKIKDVVKEHVLPLLPAKSLMKFKAVSKDWEKWIASPLLAHQQSFSCQSFSGYFYQEMQREGESKSNTMFLSLDHSTNGVPSPTLDFLPEVVKILSSCSGVLLCQGSEKYYVCNPVTRDWKMLPPHQYYHGEEPAVVLAFEPSLRNIQAYYHVICAFPMIGQPIICFDIYSSESNTWSCSSAHSTVLGYPRFVGGGLFLKGVAYFKTKSDLVLAFDVKDEIPAIISLPVQFGRHGSLTQMEGELCYVTANNESGNVFLIDIYQGMEMSLKHSVSINLGPDRSFTPTFEVLPCVNSDVVAIHIGQFIYLYHIREQKVEFITCPCDSGHGKKFLPYINSLGMVH